MKKGGQKPLTQDGFFWLFRDGKQPTICKVWDSSTSMPMVAWIGTDWDSQLKDVRGRWYGPIFPPIEKRS